MTAGCWVAAAITTWCALAAALCVALARIGTQLKKPPPRPPATRHRATRTPAWARHDRHGENR